MMHHNTQQNHIYHDRIWKTTRLVVYSHFQTIRRELKFNLFWTHSEACSQFQVIVWFRIRSLTSHKWNLVSGILFCTEGWTKGRLYWNRSTCEGGVGRHQNCRWASASHVTRPMIIFMGVAQNQPIIIQLMQRGCCYCYLRSAIQTVLYMNLLHVLVGPSITSLLFGFQLIFHRP